MKLCDYDVAYSYRYSNSILINICFQELSHSPAVRNASKKDSFQQNIIKEKFISPSGLNIQKKNKNKCFCLVINIEHTNTLITTRNQFIEFTSACKLSQQCK